MRNTLILIPFQKKQIVLAAYSFQTVSCKMLVFFLLATLTACHKESKNPELMDPIYKDLVKEEKKYQQLVEDTRVRVHQHKIKNKKLKPRSLKKRVNRKNLYKLKKQLREYEQRAQYYKIRAMNRMKEDRRNYKKAFREKKPWPPPEEYQHYLTAKKLKSVPRKWSRRNLASPDQGQKSSKGKSHAPPAHH